MAKRLVLKTSNARHSAAPATEATKVGLLIYYAVVLLVLAIAGWSAAWGSDPSPPTNDRVPLALASPAPADGGASSADAATDAASSHLGPRTGPVTVKTEPALPDSPLGPRALVVLVIIVSALGGWLQGISSLATRAGNGTLEDQWGIYYLTRPFVAAITGFLMHLVLESNAAGFHVDPGATGQRTLLAWCGLSGLFSTVAMQKLRDVFDALFRPNGKTPAPAPAAGTPSSGAPAADLQAPVQRLAPPPKP